MIMTMLFASSQLWTWRNSLAVFFSMALIVEGLAPCRLYNLDFMDDDHDEQP
jgi:hypothetical protein